MDKGKIEAFEQWMRAHSTRSPASGLWYSEVAEEAAMRFGPSPEDAAVLEALSTFMARLPFDKAIEQVMSDEWSAVLKAWRASRAASPRFQAPLSRWSDLMSKKKLHSSVTTLPKTLRVFVNTSTDEDFLQINETAEDAYIETGGDTNVIVGIYELKQKVRLRFRVDEEPV